MKTKQIKVNDVVIGGGAPFILVAGPCVIEGQEETMAIAGR